MSINTFFLFGKKKRFYKLWYSAFENNAKIYNGLYASVKRLYEGKARKPEKVVDELCSRTKYNVKEKGIEEFCDFASEVLLLSDGKNEKWIKLLFLAITNAGISFETEKELIINENNILDYIEWNLEELNEGDKVEIMNPAWYQNGKLIEQGYCTVIKADKE